MSIVTAYYHSPAGVLEITASGERITSVSFIEGLPDSANYTSAVLHGAVKQLDEYFTGKRREFNLDMELIGTDFQVSVWHELMKIPYGHTISYSQVAGNIGNKKGVRAVANAVAANKLAIIIPCHRVIGKDGTLTGYEWGIETKKHLLEHEKGKVN